MLLNNLLGSALAFAQEGDERNLFFFFGEHCRKNHLLFHALEKRTDFSCLASLHHQLPCNLPLLVWFTLLGVTASEEGAAAYFLSSRRKENAVISPPGCARHGSSVLACHG